MAMTTTTIDAAAAALRAKLHETAAADTQCALDEGRLSPSASRKSQVTDWDLANHCAALLYEIPELNRDGRREKAMRHLCWVQGVAFAMGWVDTIDDLKAANAPAFQPAPRDEAWARILRRLADELESGEAVLKAPVSQDRPAWTNPNAVRTHASGPDITTTITLHYPKVAAELEGGGYASLTNPARPLSKCQMP